MEEQRFRLGRAGGALTVREEGDRVAFEAERPDDRRGLYKVYLTGGGSRLLLGTLLPEEGKLRLRRTLTRGELERRGAWPVRGGEAELSYAPGQTQASPPPQGWRREGEPARLLGDPLLRRCASGLRGALLRREGEGFALAVRWEGGSAFPMTPIFCFARIERFGGQEYAVFRFNQCGCPISEIGE